ncbi:MAG: 23S rRNA (adenine(2503)-C(2))-methyltransferase RlmN [Clostridiales bacterium]|jgi:23S rRNA (adenine2503-C2)-methyltransferase|nr:23S rRNA (adenine(2503)-C(2))-methyltransferase RlmN [Clostridiales bacterium]
MNYLDLRSLNIEELTSFIREKGLPAFRARQIFAWLHQKGVGSFREMTNLPKELRDMLAEETDISMSRIISYQESASGDTVKWLLELADGERIETVLMHYKRDESRDRATCCVSTQTGCAMNCAFCATASFAKCRNLTAGEMEAQTLIAAEEARRHGFDGLTNVVFMGMGEPLANMDNLHRCILLLNNEMGQNIGMRKMTVSTSGLVPGIYQMADWGLQVGLAISLHSASEETRRKLMPVAGRYSFKELFAAANYYRQKTGQRVTYEYALFNGINDSTAAAKELVELLSRYDEAKDALINIIPANYVDKTGFSPSKVESIKEFVRILSSSGISVQQRESRGQDIDAACGQLAARNGQSVKL